MKIASIKLSTVNTTKADPYSLSVTVIDGRKIQETKEFRFNIEDARIENYHDYIPVSDLRTGKTLVEQWPEINELLSSFDYLCSFRVGDDFNALYQSLIKRDLPLPSVSLFDVQGIARRVFLELADYTYASIAEMLGMTVEHVAYFDVRCDSATMAELLIKMLERENIESLDMAFEKFEIKPGTMDENGYQKQVLTRRQSFVGYKDPKAKDMKPEEGTSPDPLNFFYGKNVLFTGNFDDWGLSKKECKQIVANIGGFPQDGINSQTNILVEGIQKATKKVDGKLTMSDKQKKARIKKEQGQDIEIVSGEVFWEETFIYVHANTPKKWKTLTTKRNQRIASRRNCPKQQSTATILKKV